MLRPPEERDPLVEKITNFGESVSQTGGLSKMNTLLGLSRRPDSPEASSEKVTVAVRIRPLSASVSLHEGLGGFPPLAHTE